MRIAVCVMALLAMPASADSVYKCEKDGKIVYTDQPCSRQAQPHELPDAIVITPPAQSERELARQHDARIARVRSARNQADAKWLKDHEAKKDYEQRVRTAIIEHEIIKGMSADDVRRAAGEPDKVTRSESHGSPKESWTYTSGGETRTVNFKNGEVSSITKRRKGKK